MFSVGKNGAIGGALQVENPRNLRVGVLQRGHGGLFTSKAYLVVAGSALARPGTRLLLVYADGSRSPIAPILARRPAHGGFYYYRVPTMHARARRATGLEVVRGSRVLARSDWLLSYQAPKQPGPRALRTALRLLGR
jgi:hypothetical protein